MVIITVHVGAEAVFSKYCYNCKKLSFEHFNLKLYRGPDDEAALNNIFLDQMFVILLRNKI